MATKYNRCPGSDSETEKTLGKNNKKIKKVWDLVNNNGINVDSLVITNIPC